MRFQLAALVFEGDVSNDARGVFERLGFPGGVQAGTVSFIEATSPQQSTRYLGSDGNWTLITDALPFVSMTDTAPVGSLWSNNVLQLLRESSAGGRRAFGVIMSQRSSNFGFSLHEDGAHRRSYLEQHGEVVVDEGAPLPEEKFAEGQDKQVALFQLMSDLAIPYRQFEAVRFHYFAFERNG